MAILKTGARLKSCVCDGEVMVVSAPDTDIEITCGGIAIGKRYVSEAGDVELLCVKAGDGGLAVNGALLLQKDTKKLPKTD